jgi:hypothetical protein
MKYLMLIKHAESYRSQPIPQGLMAAKDEFIAESIKTGVLEDTGGLKGTEEGFRVRSKGGKLVTTDGPFIEAKEVIGGYAIIEAGSGENARTIAHQFMDLHRIH